MSLSQNDLLVLMEKQRLVCENLRNVLTLIQDFDWPQQFQKRLKKPHKLRAAIEAVKETINKTMMSLAIFLSIISNRLHSGLNILMRNHESSDFLAALQRLLNWED
ncbi:hypothetical protein KIN20_013923 [Parelaphostrongylus tenuis]|uniref:Uncharacterized protein n=1 Tax=Parelaphostrongylus tenuis TaxID=148309 RepID=A0AAD5QLB5_PARTN|nr:hypothetical protein KIN20_013923 [Parelaphostrongylus tenuis]